MNEIKTLKDFQEAVSGIIFHVAGNIKVFRVEDTASGKCAEFFELEDVFYSEFRNMELKSVTIFDDFIRFVVCEE